MPKGIYTRTEKHIKSMSVVRLKGSIVYRKCKQCKEMMLLLPSDLNRKSEINNKKFCNKHCYREYRILKKCIYCNEKSRLPVIRRMGSVCHQCNSSRSTLKSYLASKGYKNCSDIFRNKEIVRTYALYQKTRKDILNEYSNHQ